MNWLAAAAIVLWAAAICATLELSDRYKRRTWERHSQAMQALRRIGQKAKR